MIKVLDLSDNSLSCAEVLKLLERVPDTLEILDLTGNNLRMQDLDLFLPSLQKTKINKLILTDNWQIPVSDIKREAWEQYTGRNLLLTF